MRSSRTTNDERQVAILCAARVEGTEHGVQVRDDNTGKSYYALLSRNMKNLLRIILIVTRTKYLSQAQINVAERRFYDLSSLSPICVVNYCVDFGVNPLRKFCVWLREFSLESLMYDSCF